ncbi:MAG: hypothetical protein RSB94_08595 [Erysipelotrichaceae bacterium]
MKTKQQIEDRIAFLKEKQERYTQERDSTNNEEVYMARHYEVVNCANMIHLLDWVLHEN